MKTRRFILAAVAGLISTTPAWALSGSYGEGSMWTDLIAFRDELAAQPRTAVPPLPRDSLRARRSYDGDLFEQLKESQVQRQHERAIAAEKGKAPIAAGKQEGTKLNQFDIRPYVSIYEQIAMRQGEARRS